MEDSSHDTVSEFNTAGPRLLVFSSLWESIFPCGFGIERFPCQYRVARAGNAERIIGPQNEEHVGHFRVAFSLFMKTSLRAKPCMCKCGPPTGSFSCKSNSFHMKGFAQGLVFKQRLKVTRKWPIKRRHFNLFWNFWLKFNSYCNCLHPAVDCFTCEALTQLLAASYSSVVKIFYTVWQKLGN